MLLEKIQITPLIISFNIISLSVGGEECVPLEPLNGLTEGVMLSELFSNLGTGEDGVPLDPSAPLFSEDTMNALLGEQLRETAAQVCQEMGQQQQQQTVALQQQSTAMEMQSVLSGNSTSSMRSLHEVTAAMQTHQHQAQPHLAATTATMAMTMPVNQVSNQQGQHSQQQPQPQQYLTLLDGKILHQADGSAVLTSLPSGGQPLAVALPGSTSVLQYIPVLNSQVVAVPHIQVQPSTTAAQQHQQQQQQLAVAAMAAATLSDGSGAVLPTTSGTTPPATTPTSAAAANAVYTSEISTTQQLVATAAAQQQWLQQEAANVANAGGITGATNAANIAMREAASAVADMAHQNNTIASMTGSSGTNGMAAGNGSEGGQISPRTMSMPPPPPRAPRRSLDAVTIPVQLPSLTPQLRPATTEPFPSLTAAVVAAAQAGQDTSMLNNTGDINAPQAPQSQAPPLLRPAATPATEIPDDGQLPRKPSHKRERSLRSANPITADPTTAPTIKCAKGHSGEDGGVTSSDSGLGTSPDSCILAATVAASTGGSSGDVSPLNGVYTRSDTMPEPPSTQHQQQYQQLQQPSLSAPESTTTTADANNSGSGNTNAASFEVDDDVMALMQAALTPKTGKRRGRPPGARVGIASADEPHEPTDAEILESLLKEDPTRRQLPVDELKKLVRKEKNRISAATSRNRTANYTSALESRVKALQAEQAELSGWLQAPPQALPHRVMLVGPAAAAAASAGADTTGRPPVRHLSL